MDQVGFGFSILGKILKLGINPNVVTLSTLVNGFCNQSKVAQAMSLFVDMIGKGHQPCLITYTVLYLMCFKLLRTIEERDFPPNTVAYSTVIDCLCKDRQLTKAFNLFFELKDKGIAPNTVTYSCLIHAMCTLGQQKEATRFLDEMSANNVALDVFV
ncbi:hypothetical protein DITRI_Ditri18aG0064200 [Diplodiscus trichospermus]